jgi:hypothetical protein
MFRSPDFPRDKAGAAARDPDELAIERYRYLLRTAPPDRIEEAHREAFEQLTPDQRRMALEALAREVDPREVQQADTSPASLARVATRAEMRQPGTLERAFGGQQQGWGGGGGFLGSFLPILAGAFVGTSIANLLFGSYGYPPGDPAADGSMGDSGDAGDAQGADAGADGSVEGGSWDDGSTADAGDAGGDFGGDLGGDFGDFGGGDFGGF